MAARQRAYLNTLQAGTTLAPPPTGVAANDRASLINALAGSSSVMLQPGTYVAYNINMPDDRDLRIPPGTTVKLPDNYATGAGSYYIFASASGRPTGITIGGGGTLDGNRRGGNHGLSENIFGIAWSDALRCTIDNLRFYNFRGDGFFAGHSTNLPEKLVITRSRFEDCGVKESGDSANARMGVAITAGKDILVALNQFDTIGAYAVDFEGDVSGDTFDNLVIGPNVYRGCAQGQVNVTSPGTITNVDIRDRVANGSLGISGTRVKPAALQNIQERFRTAGDLALTPGDTVAHDLPSIGDITLQGVRAGDWVRVTCNGAWDAGTTYRNLDVASVVSGSPVTYWGSRTGTLGSGVPNWRGFPSTAINFAAAVIRQVTTSDINADGSLTLRLRYSFNAAITSTLYASTGTYPLHFYAENFGATP